MKPTPIYNPEDAHKRVNYANKLTGYAQKWWVHALGEPVNLGYHFFNNKKEFLYSLTHREIKQSKQQNFQL